MKIKFIALLISIILGFFDISFSQLKQMSIGESVPNINLNIRLKDGKETNISIDSLKGKLIIFDFWNRYCASCIALFPKMEKIQEKFGDRVKIFLVTKDSKSDLKSLFEKSRIIKENKLPLIINDTILSKLFPYKAVPFHVWLDEDGRFLAGTDPTSTTEGNIAKYLEDKIVDFPFRFDENSFSVYKKRLIEQEAYTNRLKSLPAYSIITPRSILTAQSPVAAIWDSVSNNISGISIYNETIVGLYSSIMSHVKYDMVKVIVKEEKDSSLFYPPQNEDSLTKWNYLNTYCYELKLPSLYSKYSSNDYDSIMYNKAQSDLDIYFNIKSFREEFFDTCLIIKRIDSKIIKDASGASIYEKTAEGKYYMNNCNMGCINFIISELQRKTHTNYSVIDESGFDNIRFSILLNPIGNYIDLNQELNKLGLGIFFEKRNIKAVVLKMK
ncbi:thiol-disulfide isomerase/thioredoxin [Chitinophaga skermanii]|uniref:Thiol-disulfide isomerase/thioredoxin n=1 Tax=Chitinophaga skermanii TaxID=331697 RepID=A0A327R3C0_9BACT|nr:redoxin domain-containing protein [Chitinophaga skermanii]RAJ10715.1 thiol-disulfide isomerase/thioredoxin [Chitinophaga skermanii]